MCMCFFRERGVDGHAFGLHPRKRPYLKNFLCFLLTAESHPGGRADLKAHEGATRGYNPALPNVQGWGCHNFVSSFLAVICQASDGIQV